MKVQFSKCNLWMCRIYIIGILTTLLFNRRYTEQTINDEEWEAEQSIRRINGGRQNPFIVFLLTCKLTFLFFFFPNLMLSLSVISFSVQFSSIHNSCRTRKFKNLLIKQQEHNQETETYSGLL